MRDQWVEMRAAMKSFIWAPMSLILAKPESCKVSNGDEATSEGISFSHAEAGLIVMAREINRLSGCPFNRHC